MNSLVAQSVMFFDSIFCIEVSRPWTLSSLDIYTPTSSLTEVFISASGNLYSTSVFRRLNKFIIERDFISKSRCHFILRFLDKTSQNTVITDKSIFENSLKKYNLCYKLWFSNPYIFATQCHRYFILWILLDKIIKVCMQHHQVKNIYI